ncbi:MAG: (d)CMP kinase, partial [Promethearchaeota archaeon]
HYVVVSSKHLETNAMKRVITVGGLHGTGKSSVADAISKKFNLRRMSAGVIFREMAKDRNLTLEEFSRVAAGDEDIDRLIDDKLREEAEKGNAVIDGQLAAWMAGDNADLNILLIASVENRIRRISERDGTDFEYARRETITREGSEKARYIEYYGVDVSDHSVYDLIINTDKYDLEEVIAIVFTAIEEFFGKSTD